jgi:hypothetical protein
MDCWIAGLLEAAISEVRAHNVHSILKVGLSINRGAVPVAQTVLSAVSQVGNLRARLDSDASLVFTPCRLPVGDTADCQSALQRCGSWPWAGPADKGAFHNRGAVSVAQTVLSAVSQVGNLRAWLYPDASLVFTPCRLPVGDTADCQSALQRWRFMAVGRSGGQGGFP